MLDNFLQITPDVIFDAAETLGGRCTGRFLALNAMENRVYDIEMEAEEAMGASATKPVNEHIVIKFYRPGRWSRETIQAEHDFLKALDANEIPVVCASCDPTGRSVFEINQVSFAIFPKRPGRLEPELNEEQLTRLGRFLARLHGVGATFPSAPRMRLTPTTYGRDSLKTLLELKLLPDNLAPRFAQLVEQICDRIDPFFAGVETVLLHGDCHCGNILWKGDNPYFIDFDDMLFAPPVQDFWMLTGGDDSYGTERRKILIEAYEEIRDFDRATLRLIEPLRALRMIYFNAWIARRWEDGAFKMAFPSFATERYWQEQLEGLSAQWEKIAYAENSDYIG
jgi:Ser/Thr protein kinase RdoA (MazF antagonist)